MNPLFKTQYLLLQCVVKMGRKIPCKKHKGIKDPLVQQAKRLQDLKGKINAPPKDPDEQPVPRSLTQLFAFQNITALSNRDSKFKKKRVKGKNAIASHLNKNNPIALLQKLPGESGRGFSLRINSAVKALHNPILQEDYPQDIDAEDVKGERMAFQRERRKKKLKKKSEASGEQHAAPKTSRAQKLALKKEKKKKALEEREREVRYERVAFGEVAHAPPALPAPPRRAARLPGAPRPGRRELLLSAMMSSGAGAGSGGGAGAGARRTRVSLPAAELERRERARLEAVAAYRVLKGRTPAAALAPHGPRPRVYTAQPF